MSLDIEQENNTLTLTEQHVSAHPSRITQTLTIVSSDIEPEITETQQSLSISSEAASTLELQPKKLELEIAAPTMTLNQYFGEGSTSFTVEAGEALGGHRVVYVANGQAFYADPVNTSIAGQVIGVTTAATSAGAFVTVQYAGAMDEAGWEFTPGPVYLGTNGTLVQTRPATGVVLNIGVAVTPTRLLIHRTASIEVI